MMLIPAILGGQVPIDPGGGETGTTYITSENGLVGGASLAMHSTTFGPDDTDALQALADLGGDPDNLLIIDTDTASSITGVLVKSHTSITGRTGKGYILRNQADKPLVRTEVVSFTAFASENITLDGGIWNGNLYNADYNGGDRAQLKTSADQGIIAALSFYGVDGLTIKNLAIRMAGCYAILVSKVNNLLIDNLTIDQGSDTAFGSNQDGVHLLGNVSNFTISNISMLSRDDSIAINAADIYQTPWDAFYKVAGVVASTGPIEHGVVENIVLQAGNIFGIRVLCGTSRIDDIIFRNFSGQTNEYWCIADTFAGMILAGSGNIGSLTFDNIDVMVLGRAFPPGAGWDSDVVWGLNVDGIITFNNIKRRVYIDDLWSTWNFHGGAVLPEVIISAYTANDLAASPNQAVGKDIPHIVVDNAQVGIMRLTRAIVSKASTENNSRLIHVKNGGIIQILYLTDCTIDDIAKLVWIEDGYVDVIILKNTSHTNASGNASIDIDSHSVQYLASEGYGGTSLSSGTVDATSSDADAPIPGGITYHTL
jgi:hypothetical protein